MLNGILLKNVKTTFAVFAGCLGMSDRRIVDGLFNHYIQLIFVYKQLKFMETASKLSNLQIEILKLFQYNLPDKQLIEIKNILTAYFAESATEEMDKLWEENNWNGETMKAWANEHLRK